MSRCILSAFADEYSAEFECQLEALSRFGIDHVELRHVDGKNVSTLTEREMNAVADKLARSGIRASAIGSPIGKIRLDGDMEAHLQTAERVFAFAKQLGTRYVRMFSFYPPEGGQIAELEDEVFLRVGQLIALADKYGVTLCHENEARIYGDTPERCRKLLDYFGGKLLCVFDMGNFVLEGVEPYAAYEMLREYIAYFHIKDALYEGAIVPPGKGEARIADILAAHREYSKTDFFVSLEPHLETFSGLNALVGRGFENPYRYPDPQTAFTDAVECLARLIN